MKFSYQNSLIDSQAIDSLRDKQAPYLENLKRILERKAYEDPEASINLSFDKDILARVEKLKTKFSNVKYILNIGIGGSNLGTRAIYDAIFGYFDLLEPRRFPKMIFADTNEPEFLAKLISFLEKVDAEEILINAISKSGETTEPLVNLEIIINSLKERSPDIFSRLVITTDLDSKLWRLSQDLGIDSLSVPKQVGGRFSVLSSVGLFPLFCAGVDIESLLEGAREIVNNFLNIDNPAYLSSAVLYLSKKSGFIINDNFFFHPQLESLGKWYRQLMGESVGKEKDKNSNIVHAGITPTVSIGSTDLHSMGQLYLGGPKNTITTFVSSGETNEVSVPNTLNFPSLSESVKGKSAAEVMNAIYEGVKIAYQKKALPFMEIILDDLSEKSLGKYLQFKMLEMMLLGNLLNVNTFDQPNVEDYKKETRKILSRLE